MIRGTCSQMAYQSNITRNTLGGGGRIKGHTTFSWKLPGPREGKANCYLSSGVISQVSPGRESLENW